MSLTIMMCALRKAGTSTAWGKPVADDGVDIMLVLTQKVSPRNYQKLEGVRELQ